MKKIIVALGLVLTVSAWAFSPDTTIWLDRSAKLFTESLPLGNGRLGRWILAGSTLSASS
jgi:hypothetical protein